MSDQTILSTAGSVHDLASITEAGLSVAKNLAKRERSNLAKTLPTDRLSFEKQVDVLRAYAAVFEANGGNPVSNDEAGQALSSKLAGGTLAMAIPFYSDVGLLARADGGRFTPSQELTEYNKALQWNEAEAKRKLRPLFERSWFFRALSPRLALNPLSIGSCLGTLAIEAKAEKEHEARLGNLISYLELAGIVCNDSGTVRLQQSFAAPLAQVTSNEPESRQGAIDGDSLVLYLDKDRTRKVILNAPLLISRAEYDRLCKWIEVSLIVEEKIVR